MKTRSCLIVFALALVPLGAQAALSDADREVLESFYHAANGDDWHRNDGWLEPGSDACEWYGVECGSRFGLDHEIVSDLELPANNLSGSLDARIFEIVHDRLDLSDNELGGTLDLMPSSPGRVDLSNNLLEGSLPAEMSAPSSDFNWYLDLSGNEFEGEVPEGWEGPKWLNLANNRLEGMPLNLFDDAPRGGGRFLDLSDNQFSGALPTSLMEGSFMPHNGSSRWGGGINLCWNDWAIPESVAFQDWLRDHHVGGEFEQCLSAERAPIAPEISGSWYDPARSGEGIVVHELASGLSMIYFFTFDEEGRQQWLLDVQAANATNVRWREMLRTRGRFGEGLLETDDDSIEVRGSFRIDHLGNDRMMAERVYIDETTNICISPYPPPLSCFGNSLSDRLEYQRLSHLAGTTCDNQSDFQQYSGAWYNPERSGEGFIVEVLPDDRVVVYWFTHQPDDSGQQAWMIGSGAFNDDGIIIDPPPPWEERVRLTLLQPSGARFGPQFDPDDVQVTEWGELELRFNGDGTGQVVWNSEIEGYGSGDYDIERLAQPKFADCTEGDSQ